jgi:hypothetical protein
MVFTNRDIVNTFDNKLDNGENAENAFEMISRRVKINEDKEEKLLRKLRTFVSHYLTKWRSCSRSRARFEAKCASWLDLPFDVKEFIQRSGKSTKKTRPIGRPRKDFSDLSARGKRRRLKEERDANSNIIN